MKIIRYEDPAGKIGYASEDNGTVLAIRGDIFDRFEVTTEKVSVRKRLAPIVPSTLWCIGLNYKNHAKESNFPIPEYPVLFAKSPSALQNPGDPIEIPVHMKSEEVDFECELAVVIGRRATRVKADRAYDYVLGYTALNDVTARDFQFGDGQWQRGSAFHVPEQT